ncbi:MAG: hypothetical protein HOV68_01515 [Streptomycetaceae bacterium]|nr:hypothetical protein [Streptomycetaceae bacterium]
MIFRPRRTRALTLAVPVLILGGLLSSAQPAAAARGPVRPYQATGTPVLGSINGCSDAPLITPGRYLDGFTGGRSLYYKVKKRTDQQLQVSATAIAEEGYSRNSGLTVSAGTIGKGDPENWLRSYAQSSGWATVITAGARSQPGKGNETPAPDDTGCILVKNKITDAGDMPMKVELRVGIADDATARAGEQLPQPRTGPAAEGGFSFDNATPIGPGTYRQSLAVGEAPFWRVDLKAGQQLTVKAGVDIPTDFPRDFPSSIPTGWTVQIYNATRSLTTCDKNDASLTVLFSEQTGRFERTCGPWQVSKPEDAGSFDPNGYAVPGTYYIQLQIAEPTDGMKGFVVPIDLTVDVAGTPRPGADPVFSFAPDAGSAPSGTGKSGTAGGTGDAQAPSGTSQDHGAAGVPSESAASKDDESLLGRLALPVGIGLAVALLGWAAFHGLRRRGGPPG